MGIFNWFRKDHPTQHKVSPPSSNGVGIALSGGSAKGYAHIGVLKALEEHGVQPFIVAGTSMGSLIGLFYAAGFSPDEIKGIIQKESPLKMVKMAFGKHGLFEMRGLRKILEDVMEADDFSALKKPFYLSVTNLNKGIHEIRNSGPLIDYVIASCSIPIVFAPIEIDGTTYIDGGLFNNLPAESIRDKCDYLIGVNVNPVGEVDKFGGIKEIAERSFSLEIDRYVQTSKVLCNVVIEPPAMQNYSFWDFDKMDEIVEVGYQHTNEMIATGQIMIPSPARP